MEFFKSKPLAQYSTMRLGGDAKYMCEVTNKPEIEEAVIFARTKNLKVHVVGGGSNSIFGDDGFDGLIIVNKILGVNASEEEDGSISLTAGAGENWDDIVAKSVENGYSDIAALSLIPGTAGGAPVQNIGAYGQQVSDSIISITAFNILEQKWEIILRQDCNFAYRTSRFNQQDKGNYIISEIEMRLSRKSEKSPFYKDIERYFQLNNISVSKISASDLRRAVIAVRQAKLPDPTHIANTGSFFKNPVVSVSEFEGLLRQHPQLKSHQTDDGKLKLYAGQLIELAGLKDYHDRQTGMATWKNQALVLINEQAKTTKDLLDFKQKIIHSVHATFGITLEQEPEMING